MKKLILSLAIMTSVLFGTTQKSEAGVGALISAPVVMTVGGLAAATGTFLFVDVSGLLWQDPITCSRGDWNWSCMGPGILSVILVPAGLLILEEEGGLTFSKVKVGDKTVKNFSRAEIAVYNEELDQLNAINAQIVEEAKSNPEVNTTELWKDLGSMVSESTLQIAGETAAAFLNQKK